VSLNAPLALHQRMEFVLVQLKFFREYQANPLFFIKYSFCSLAHQTECPTNCEICSADFTCTACSSRYFLTPDGACANCNETCLTCDGDTQFNCLTCEDPFFHLSSSNECALSCGENQYGDANDRTCKQCPSGCPSCELGGDGTLVCLACSDDHYLNGTVCERK
jgi:hypothetical protein